MMKSLNEVVIEKKKSLEWKIAGPVQKPTITAFTFVILTLYFYRLCL